MGFQRVGVLGAGIMGGGIAEVAAATGATVIVRSRGQATADAVLAVVAKSLAKQVERGKRTSRGGRRHSRAGHRHDAPGGPGRL